MFLGISTQRSFIQPVYLQAQVNASQISCHLCLKQEFTLSRCHGLLWLVPLFLLEWTMIWSVERDWATKMHRMLIFPLSEWNKYFIIKYFSKIDESSIFHPYLCSNLWPWVYSQIIDIFCPFESGSWGKFSKLSNLISIF